MDYSLQRASNHQFLKALVASVAVVAVAVMLIAHLVGSFSNADSVKSSSGKSYAKLQNTSKPADKSERADTFTHRLGFSFTDKDLNNYRAAFEATESGDWKSADRAMAQIHDDVLMGALRAQRFLSPDYKADFKTLSTWLKRYSDMPIAARVHDLADQKKSGTDKLQPIGAVVAPLKGSGTRDGISNEVMPKAWQAGLEAWMDREYHSAYDIFKTVANEPNISPWHRSAAHFWASRAAKKAGYTEEAKLHLEEAAKAPFTLYGTLARHALGDKEPLKVNLPALDRDILAIPAIKRAAAYVALERVGDADRELRQLFMQLPHRQKKQLITVASKLNLPDLQLRMSQMLYKDSSKSNGAAYPVPQWIPAYDMELDPALVYSIARQESGFDLDVVSKAGAVGVMQIMPDTADYIVNKYNHSDNQLIKQSLKTAKAMRNQKDYLRDPVLNVVLGQRYLAYLSEKDFIKGNLIHLIAAYNAGPNVLQQWKKRYSHIKDPLLFVEMIPYKETRHYVKQVLTNYVIYNELLHGRSDESFALMRGNWPTVATPTIRVAAVAPNLLAELK